MILTELEKVAIEEEVRMRLMSEDEAMEIIQTIRENNLPQTEEYFEIVFRKIRERTLREEMAMTMMRKCPEKQMALTMLLNKIIHDPLLDTSN